MPASSSRPAHAVIRRNRLKQRGCPSHAAFITKPRWPQHLHGHSATRADTIPNTPGNDPQSALPPPPPSRYPAPASSVALMPPRGEYPAASSSRHPRIGSTRVSPSEQRRTQSANGVPVDVQCHPVNPHARVDTDSRRPPGQLGKTMIPERSRFMRHRQTLLSPAHTNRRTRTCTNRTTTASTSPGRVDPGTCPGQVVVDVGPSWRRSPRRTYHPVENRQARRRPSGWRPRRGCGRPCRRRRPTHRPRAARRSRPRCSCGSGRRRSRPPTGSTAARLRR